TGRVVELGQPWRGVGPFLFTAYHRDNYPRGNGNMGPATDLSGRPMGGDFGNPAGWSMYHGREVPGFPAHPHRGFETITIVREGEPGAQATVRVMAGPFRNVQPLSPPSHSWASDSAADVAVWVIDLDPHVTSELPPTNRPETRRLLYLHGDGATAEIDDHTVKSGKGYEQTT